MYTISPHLIEKARFAYIACIGDRLAKHSLINADNNMSWNSLLTFVMSAAALEALINELCFVYNSLPSNPPKPELAGMLEERIGVRRKYLEVPSCLWGKWLTRKQVPDNDVIINKLFFIRNPNI